MIDKQELGSHAIVFPLAAFMREQLGFQTNRMIRKMNSMRAHMEGVFQLTAEAAVYQQVVFSQGIDRSQPMKDILSNPVIYALQEAQQVIL